MTELVNLTRFGCYSERWGIKDRFSESLMPDISHSFCFSLLCNCCHKQTLKQKRSQNKVRLRRFASSYNSKGGNFN